MGLLWLEFQKVPGRLTRNVPCYCSNSYPYQLYNPMVICTSPLKLRIEEMCLEYWSGNQENCLLEHCFSHFRTDPNFTCHQELIISSWCYTLPTDHLIQNEIPTWVCCIGLSIQLKIIILNLGEISTQFKIIVLSWIVNPMQQTQVGISSWIKWSVGRVYL